MKRSHLILPLLLAIALIVIVGCAATSTAPSAGIATTQPSTQPTNPPAPPADPLGAVQTGLGIFASIAAFVPGWGTVAAAAAMAAAGTLGVVKVIAAKGAPKSTSEAIQDGEQIAAEVLPAVGALVPGAGPTMSKIEAIAGEAGTLAGLSGPTPANATTGVAAGTATMAAKT